MTEDEEKHQIIFDVGNDKVFHYYGKIINEDEFFITISDDKRGEMRLNKKQILRIEPYNEEDIEK